MEAASPANGKEAAGPRVKGTVRHIKALFMAGQYSQCCQIVQVAISVFCRIQQFNASTAGRFGATFGCKIQCVGAWKLKRSRELTKLAAMVLLLLVLVMFLIKILSELHH